jgi:hypothetical protein
LSLPQGTFPSKFKHASVTPLLKKPGLDPSVSANFYLSTSITSPKFYKGSFLHVCNHIMLSHLISILCSQPIANITLPKLLFIHLLDSIYHAADNGLTTLLLSLDLSAAFDTIDHVILLNRLTSSFGIMDPSHHWLKFYLLNRSFPVASSSTSSPNLIVILWCSIRLCLGSYSFHNLCLTYCFNCILSRCQSKAIR